MIPKKFKHLDFDDRKTISNCISQGLTEAETARRIGVSPSTVGREVERHAHYTTASRLPCPRLRRWPRTCDGCHRYYGKGCALGKMRYDAAGAEAQARRELSDSRRGIDMGKEEFAEYDEALRKAVVEDGESVYSASLREGMPSKSTIYRHVGSGSVSVSRKDLPRAPLLKKRKRAEKAYDYSGNYAYPQIKLCVR